MVIGGASAAERPGTPVPPVPTSNDAPVASEVRLGGDDTQTRLVVDLSQKIDVRAFTLANPYRVVMDMPQVTFRLPPKTGEAGRGLIKAFRFGLVMQGGSRIVIDLA
ncbi:MAG TPA: AMIN domain-containing protein, partial [Xanthobacteraceae bacterium]